MHDYRTNSTACFEMVLASFSESEQMNGMIYLILLKAIMSSEIEGEYLRQMGLFFPIFKSLRNFTIFKISSFSYKTILMRT